MKTLVFAFEVGKLNDAEFQNFMQKLFDAQQGFQLGLCTFNTFDLNGTMDIHRKLDELRDPEGNEKEPTP